MIRSGGVVKKFSTVETLQRLLKYRDIMFSVIEETDRQQGSGIAESDFLRFVSEYQNHVAPDVVKEIFLTFDIQNLQQAKILNDRKIVSGVTKLWFNTSVMEIFRLCKISLYRPLTGIALNNAMQCNQFGQWLRKSILIDFLSFQVPMNIMIGRMRLIIQSVSC